MKTKHAYLVVAYNNWEILQLQFDLLDHPQNDIYLTIDSKQAIPPWLFDNLKQSMKQSGLHIMPPQKVYWAEFSQVQVMLNMIKAAMDNEKDSDFHYTYFHFFSGTCLPIKSQKHIHDFCDKQNKEFIGIVPREFWYCNKRVRFYWWLIDTPYYHRFKAIKALSTVLALCQRPLGVNRIKHFDGKIYNGWDWASITHEFATYLTEKESLIKKMFKKTLCPSELCLHTLALNSPFKDRLFDVNSLRNGSMRYIDWQRGRPYTWGAEDTDFDTLMDSPYLFARKFDVKHRDIVLKLHNFLKQQD